MTEFKYCVYCEDEPAICFESEAEAMKFAREDTSMYNSVRVEKSEVDEDGDVLNTEVLWTASGKNVPEEKEVVSDNEFETDFPESDVKDFNISDDESFGEQAWESLDTSIKEAVDALEENEDEVECKVCFELGPKAEMKRLDIGYVCPKCAQELQSHQGTNLDLIDKDPFDLEYDDPRDFDDPEEIEVKEEPVDANEVRKFEAGIEEKLNEDVMSLVDQVGNRCLDFWESQRDLGKDNPHAMAEYNITDPEEYADYVVKNIWTVDDIYASIKDKVQGEESEVKKLIDAWIHDSLEFEVESLKEHVNDRPADIESDQVLQGTDNAVVDCEVAKVVAHSEDEKPLDCEMEKPALEEPLAGEEVNVKINEDAAIKEQKLVIIDWSSKTLANDNAKYEALKARAKTEYPNAMLLFYHPLELKAAYGLVANKPQKVIIYTDHEIKLDYFGRLLFALPNLEKIVRLDKEAREATTKTEDLSEEEVKELDKEVETLEEELKIIIDFSEYKPWSGAVDTYELIKDADKLDDLEAYLEDCYPDGITATQINDILWFDSDQVLSYLGLGDVEEEDEVDESLQEAKKDDELPVDPEAAKLQVHTMLNDLVADEIEAINGYEEAKKEILDTPIAHKDNILDTIDHVEDEEKEHVDELIAATTEIPFDKEEAPAPVVEEPLNQDFPEVEEDLKEAAPDTPFDSDIKEGDKIRIVHLEGEDNSYDGKEGTVEHIDSIGQLHGTWGGLAVIPGVDDFDIITDEGLKEEVITETAAKPEGDKKADYNNGLKLAKVYNKPVIYGYTNKSLQGKYFTLDDPIVCDNVSDETKKFKARYSSCGQVYVAYPNKDFAESLKLSEGLDFEGDKPEVFTPEEQKEYNCDEDGNCLDSYDKLHHCGWCGEIFTEYEMRREADFGWLCDRCIDELKSHGGPLTFIEEAVEKKDPKDAAKEAEDAVATWGDTEVKNDKSNTPGTETEETKAVEDAIKDW